MKPNLMSLAVTMRTILIFICYVTSYNQLCIRIDVSLATESMESTEMMHKNKPGCFYSLEGNVIKAALAMSSFERLAKVRYTTQIKSVWCLM